MKVADAVLGAAALLDQKTNSAVHRLLPASTSQLLAGLQKQVTEFNQEKLSSSLPEDCECILSHEGIVFSKQHVDEPSVCDEPRISLSPIGLESSPAHQPQEQESSSNNPVFPQSVVENEQNWGIYQESHFELTKENNTKSSPLRKPNSTETELLNKPEILLMPRTNERAFSLSSVKSHEERVYQPQQARICLPHTRNFDSSLPTDTAAARKSDMHITSGFEKMMAITPILPEQCSTPIIALPASNLDGGLASAVTTFSSRTSPSVDTLTSTTAVIATASPTVATPTFTAAAAATSSFLSTHGAFTPNLCSKPVRNSSSGAALVVQRALMLYACWNELLSNQQLEAASLGLAGTSFGPALMNKFGGPLQVEALATQAEALLEKALDLSALQCRPPLIRPLLEVLKYNKGPDAALARLRLFLRHHHSLPEAQRAGLQHLMAHHPRQHRLQLHILQNLQQLCPRDDSVLLLAQTLLDYPSAFGHHRPVTTDCDVDIPATPATAGSTSASRSETGDTNTAAHGSRASRSHTGNPHTTMSPSRAKPTHGSLALAQIQTSMKNSTAEMSYTYTGYDEKCPDVIAEETSSTGASALKTVEEDRKNESDVAPRTKCPLQKECVVQSTVCAVRVLVRLLQFPRKQAVLHAWQLLRRAFVLLHTSWIRCWQCSGCRWSREAVASLVTVYWLEWWRQHNAPGLDSTGARNCSALSGTGTTAPNSSGDRNSDSTDSNKSGTGNCCALSGTATIPPERNGANSRSASSGTVTMAPNSSASSGTLTRAPDSSGDSRNNVFFSATERLIGISNSAAPEACSSLNSFHVAELAMHRAVVAHIFCIDDDCGKWCDALRRGGWNNMAKELKDTVGAQGPFKENFTRYKRTLLYRHAMLFSGSVDAGGATVPHASAPRQAWNTQLPRPLDITKDSVQGKRIESLNPHLKTRSKFSASEDLVEESSVPQHQQPSNGINVDCSCTPTLLNSPSGPAAADSEALCDSSCSTVVFGDDHLRLELHNSNKSPNVTVQTFRMPQRTVSDRSKPTCKHSGYHKKDDSLASDQHEDEDRKNAGISVAEVKSSANSSWGEIEEEPIKVEDYNLGYQDDIGTLLQTSYELENNLQHSGGTLPASSRDGTETACRLSRGNGCCLHSSTGGRESRSPGTHCGIEAVTVKVKEENNSDDANNYFAAGSSSIQNSKLNNWSHIADHRRKVSSEMGLLKIASNIARSAYETCLVAFSFDDHAADSALTKPFKQRDESNSTGLGGKMSIALQDCSFSSNSEESNGMMYQKVNEVISSLESPPVTKRRKREAQNAAVDAHCEPLPKDDNQKKSPLCSADFESRLQRDVTSHLGRAVMKQTRPIGSMFAEQNANKTGVRKMELGLVRPCFVRLDTLESHKFVTSRNARLWSRPTPKQ